MDFGLWSPVEYPGTTKGSHSVVTLLMSHLEAGTNSRSLISPSAIRGRNLKSGLVHSRNEDQILDCFAFQVGQRIPGGLTSLKCST